MFVFCIAAISRAIPIMLRQSGLFGVRSSSTTMSESSSAFATLSPTDLEGLMTMIPLLSGPRPNSPSLQSIPSDVTPRIIVFSRINPSGKTVPGRAVGESISFVRLGAPHTTEIIRSPISTSQTCNLSAFGWGLILTTRPTTTLSK